MRSAALVGCLLLAVVSGGAVASGGSAASAAPVASAAPSGSRVAFTLADPRISEASGIAVGVRSPGVVYVQNDSGDSARFFAVDHVSGATVATVTVAGAENVDWEDIAAAPDAAGTPSVWLADIGDNNADRSEVDVYRVDEPVLGREGAERSITTARADVWRLRYPSGPVDAESFAVAPGGVGYVVTKSALGASVVYRLPARPDATRVQTLTRVAALQLTPTGTSNPFGLPGQVAATGAAFSPDGSRFALRTYSDVRVWSVRSGDLASALDGTPAMAALPEQKQGEGVTFDGDRLLVDSEGVDSPVWSVSAPVVTPSAVPPSRPGAATASSTAASSSSSRPSASHPSSATAAPAGSRDRHGPGVTAAVVFGGALAVLTGACLLNRRRFRRRPG